MGLFTDISYSILAKERRERYEREGRAGESLGFINRPDLNHPWGEEQGLTRMDVWVCAALFAVAVLGSLSVIWS